MLGDRNAEEAMLETIRGYWNAHIHDLEITRHPVGTMGFFSDLDEYHFEKLNHLLRLVDFDGFRDRRVLEVGCGAGTDLVRFALGGAKVTGVDLAPSAIEPPERISHCEALRLTSMKPVESLYRFPIIPLIWFMPTVLCSIQLAIDT